MKSFIILFLLLKTTTNNYMFMKSTIRILAVAFTAATLALCSCGSSSTTEAKQEATPEIHSDSLMPLAEGEKYIYQCPMHPEEVSDKPGTCSKCGMDLEKVIVKDTLRK
jgi:hypothetical protein